MFWLASTDNSHSSLAFDFALNVISVCVIWKWCILKVSRFDRRDREIVPSKNKDWIRAKTKKIDGSSIFVLETYNLEQPLISKEIKRDKTIKLLSIDTDYFIRKHIHSYAHHIKYIHTYTQVQCDYFDGNSNISSFFTRKHFAFEKPVWFRVKFIKYFY